MTTDCGRVLRTGLSQAEPVSRLGPSGFDPSRWMRRNGLRKEWVQESVTSASGAMIARKHGAPFEWGEPVATFAWTREVWRSEWDCSATTKAVACLFANGRVCDIRFGARGTTTTFYTAPAIAMEARRGETEGLDAEHDSAAITQKDGQ